MTRILCTIFLCIAASICSAADEAETYEDCILDNMKGVTSDVAAQAIKEACTAKYNTTVIPDAENETAEISQAELNASDKLKYCHDVSAGRLSSTMFVCGKSLKEVSKTEYLRLQSLQAVQNQRQQNLTSTEVQPPLQAARQNLYIYCVNTSNGRDVWQAKDSCGRSGRKISGIEYGQIKQGSTSREVRQTRSQQTYSQQNTSSVRSSTSSSSNRMSTGEFLQKWGNILDGYPTDATAEERRDIDRQKADDCEQALRMNTYRKINGQAQQALPIGCY